MIAQMIDIFGDTYQCSEMFKYSKVGRKKTEAPKSIEIEVWKEFIADSEFNRQ